MNTKEIQKLRRKFIIIAMLSFFMVMFFIGMVINVTSHTISINSIKSTLDSIEQNGGLREDTEITDQDMTKPFSPGIADAFAPTYKHNHFFFLKFDATGTFNELESNTLSADETELVKSYSETIMKHEDSFGHYGVYYYKKTVKEDGTVTLTLLDCTSELANSLRLLLATLITTLVALGITFILVRVLSGKLIQPEIENAKRQRQFITNASHELKTPLAVIRANTELLEVTGGENEWTKSTLNQVDHLNGLIQNLVMISRAQEKEDTSNLTVINASEIVEQSAAPYVALARQSEKELKLNIEKDVSVLADESKIRQLTTILIDNAIKYCDDKGKVKVTLQQSKRGKNRIRLAVSNNYAEGEGVDCNRFFDRFYREDQSHNIDKGGYGIGLSIAESICRQYGGTIRASFKEGVITFACII